MVFRSSERASACILHSVSNIGSLAAGNDITVIALWLGHEQIATTQIYLHADLTHKQRAIERTRPLGVKPGRFQPSDALLAFLEAL
jgi:integrase/recombinase XerD